MARAQHGSLLTLHYRLSGPDGADIINTFQDKPATLSLGSGELAPAFEHCLLGMEEGASARFELPAGAAFGDRNPQLRQRVGLALLREHGDAAEAYAVGDVVQFPAPDGRGLFTGVLKALGPAHEGWAEFDFNHPLAGAPVTFEVRLIGVL